MKILVVDDQESNRMLLRYSLESDGHNCIEAEDGEEAVRLFKEHSPHCILMDVMMPNMDGYEATRLIKQHAGDHHVPVIFLTAKQDQESLLKCLEVGGDDYLTKPFNEIMLKARILAHSRTQELTEQIQVKNEELTHLHTALQQEHEMGSSVLNHALQKSLQGCANIRSYVSSTSTFNGDLLLLAEKPGGGLYVLLGDFTGHGLSAAIGAIPLSLEFFAQCAKGASVQDIVSSMNSALKSFLPANMFCATSLLELNETGDKVIIWAGGLPDILVIRDGAGIVKVIESQHTALGIFAENNFNSDVQTYELSQNDRLLLMTDGILEGENQTNEMFGEARLCQSIGQGEEAYFEKIQDNYQRFTSGVAQQDDISLVEVCAGPVVIKK